MSFTAKNLLFDLGLVSDVGDDLEKVSSPNLPKPPPIPQRQAADPRPLTPKQLRTLANRVAAVDEAGVDDSTEEALADAHDR